MSNLNDSNKDITRESYNHYAAEFASHVAELAPLRSITRLVSLMSAKAAILDLGCGSGRDAKIFSDLGVDVVGIDYSSELLQIAALHAPNAKFMLMDMEELTFADASFDGIWAACSLGHIPKAKLPGVLAALHKVLKKHGYFHLAMKKGQGEALIPDARYKTNPQKFWALYDEKEISQMLENVGFRVVECELVEVNHPYLTHDAFRILCQS